MSAIATLFEDPDQPIPPGGESGIVTTADRLDLRWAAFPPHAAPVKGTVLLLQGRGDCIERWFETVRDLQIRGFAVVTFDWRGQGGSTRLARDPRKGHVADFAAYDFDLDAIVRKVLPGLPQPTFLMAHSTGCLIAAANAARLKGVIRRAVFLAPFFGLGRHGVPERLARGLARLLRGLGAGRAWVPGGGATAVHCTPFSRNRLTSDPVRHARGAEFAWRRPQVTIGSATIGWLAAAFDAQARVFGLAALDAYRLPTLVITAGADVVVSNRATEAFVVATRTTEELVVPGARHELMHERDRYREQVWAAFDAFVPGSAAATATIAEGPPEESSDPTIQIEESSDPTIQTEASADRRSLTEGIAS